MLYSEKVDQPGHLSQIFNPLYTEGPWGWYLFITKMSIVYKNACQASFLQQNPIKLYIFMKCIKNTFASIIEIMTHVKIVMSQSA